MKIIKVFLLVPLGIVMLLQASCDSVTKPSVESAVYTRLDSLYRHRQYFELHDAFDAQKDQLSTVNRLIVQAKLSAVYNRRRFSNSTIDTLFSQHLSAMPDSVRIGLLETESQNSVFLFDYRQALQATRKLLAFDSLLTKSQKDEYEKNRVIYQALSEVPAQITEVRESILPITKDIAGLSRIPVVIGSTKQQAVFDTGANFSVITDELAEKKGLQIVGAPFKVDALSGQEVSARIGICDRLALGNSVLQNVIFLVFPKESLSFPQIHYSIGMIIGFPVINSLEEVQFINGRELHIPGRSSQPENPNMALDFLTPVVKVQQGERALPFTFDTGASSTQLYNRYYRLHKTDIDHAGRRDSVRIGGAGGAKSTRVFITSFSGRIGRKPFRVDSALVFEHPLGTTTKGIYGNIGQDVFSQFDTLTVNFKHMFVQVQ